MNAPSKRLAGKVALITGAARRVGRVIARTLAEEGADIALHYRSSEEEARAAAAEFESLGVRAALFRADLSDSAEAETLAGRVVAGLGRIDVCVPSASIFPRTPIESLEPETWDRVMALNLRSVYQVCRGAGLWMRDHHGGSIVTIGDWAGQRPYTGYLPYCVSKAGVIALTQALARELAPGVRVNCVCPGPVLLPEDFDDEDIEGVRTKVLLKRIGKPEDVAEAVRFLAAASDFTTGAVINVDGGRLIA